MRGGMRVKVLENNKLSGDPTLEQWKELYEIAKDIRKLEPWMFLWDTDLITLDLPGLDEPVYCSVMGREGDCIAIGVYPGYEAFWTLQRLANPENDPFVSGLEQKCLILNYGDREEVTPIDRSIYNELGLRFRGRNEWIYFRSMDPGYYPWYIDSEQAEMLLQVLRHLFDAVRFYIEQNLNVDFDSGETLLRFRSPIDGKWITTIAQMPEIPVIEEKLVITNDILIARMKTYKRNGIKLEFEITYVPAPICEHKDARPYFPRFIILADRTSGVLLDQELVNISDAVEVVVINTLTDYIEKHGRPLFIYVRDDRTGRYIEDFCTKSGIKMIVGEDMPAIDEFIDNLFAFL
jgi:hypothetical protein